MDSVRSIAAQVTDDMIIILNPAPALLDLASEILAGEVAAVAKRFDEAIAHLRVAVRLEDALTYDEPPPWYHSARNRLGEVLLTAGRPSDAEAAFREDLWFVRENGWSLSGLERALRAQGKDSEAAEIARRFADAWQYADSPAHSHRE
jgi:tetratricopeptide (TPR) repeat protein